MFKTSMLFCAAAVLPQAAALTGIRPGHELMDADDEPGSAFLEQDYSLVAFAMDASPDELAAKANLMKDWGRCFDTLLAIATDRNQDPIPILVATIDDACVCKDENCDSAFVEISPHGHDLQTDAATDYAVDARSAASTDYSTNPSFVQLHLETSTEQAEDYWINLSTGWKIAICVIVGVIGLLIAACIFKMCGVSCGMVVIVLSVIAVIVLIVIFVIKDGNNKQ